MDLTCRHVMLNVSDVEQAKTFYVSVLGFPILEDHPKMFAFRAGQVRFSVFGGGRKLDLDSEEDSNTSVLFCTDDIVSAVDSLKAKGVRFEGEVQEAPGFMKFIQMYDPDNNQLYLGQYLTDPLLPA